MENLRRGAWLVVGLVGCFTTLEAQNTAEGWAALQTDNATLRGDVIRTEKAIDLVQASVADSIVEKNKQRLKGFGGWILQRTASRFWLMYDERKQKYVGTSSRPFHIYDGMADEVDVNIFLMPHLKNYIQMVRTGFDQARERPRGDNAFRFDAPEGYPLPEELKFEDRGYITIECEVTPPQKFAGVLEKELFPVKDGDYALDTIPGFGTKNTSFGMTGVWCMDCNHNCRPEIHPIEWLWWMDLSENRPATQTWHATLMVDGSNRFHDWSPSPISGEIAIPFFVTDYTRHLEFNLKHIVSDPVSKAEASLPLPETAFQSADTTFRVPITIPDSKRQAINADLNVQGGWPSTSTHYWISNLKAVEGGYGGYFHVSTTAESMLAFELSISTQEH
ncbi:MAG: hypothetical protein RLZZ519_45 [Bacteroidota bacterium]